MRNRTVVLAVAGSVAALVAVRRARRRPRALVPDLAPPRDRHGYDRVFVDRNRVLHQHERHAAFEYATTRAPLLDRAEPWPPGAPPGEGWVVNVDRYGGSRRFDGHEFRYWRRSHRPGRDVDEEVTGG